MSSRMKKEKWKHLYLKWRNIAPKTKASYRLCYANCPLQGRTLDNINSNGEDSGIPSMTPMSICVDRSTERLACEINMEVAHHSTGTHTFYVEIQWDTERDKTGL